MRIIQRDIYIFKLNDIVVLDYPPIFRSGIFARLEAPFLGKIIRVPTYWLEETPTGIKPRILAEGYDVELLDGSSFTAKQEMLKLATPIAILLYF